MKRFFPFLCLIALMTFSGCGDKVSRVEQYRAEKLHRDSVGLTEQRRTLAYFTTQQDSLVHVADSLLTLFKYEKNEKYQDRGFYVATNRSGLRVLVRDDGARVLVYRNGKRLPDSTPWTPEEQEVVDKGNYLAITIRDLSMIEKQIQNANRKIHNYEIRIKNSQLQGKK